MRQCRAGLAGATVLYERDALGLAASYVLDSVGFSIAGLFAALALVRFLT
jgi:CrcB protein